ncbi:DNA cytosine methyltransferase [Caulobacter segnis]|nr:DNA cytosine methyltransferase [Caulobacter segnis]
MRLEAIESRQHDGRLLARVVDNDAMKLVELFCGTGGFSRGAHAAGFEVAVAYDLDKTLTSSYEINFPQTKLRHEDVGELTGDKIRAEVGDEVFGLFGGPPCQGFSDIGRRDVSDPRRLLLGHFFRLVKEVKPAFFIMENVRGLKYSDSLPLLTDAIASVQEDYKVSEPEVFNAADFGAATVRNRIFVVGIRKDIGATFDRAELLKLRRPAATVQQAIEDLESAVEMTPSESLQGFDRWKIEGKAEPSSYASKLRAKDCVFTGHMATAHTPAVVRRFSEVAPGAFDLVGRHPRLKPDGQCPTLRAGTGSDRGSYQAVRPIHPKFNRVITVREAARLQGFPDDHVFHPTIWHSFRMIGNSVSPIMAEAVFNAIKSCLKIVTDNSSSTAENHTPTSSGPDIDIAAE